MCRRANTTDAVRAIMKAANQPPNKYQALQSFVNGGRGVIPLALMISARLFHPDHAELRCKHY